MDRPALEGQGGHRVVRQPLGKPVDRERSSGAGGSYNTTVAAAVGVDAVGALSDSVGA